MRKALLLVSLISFFCVSLIPQTKLTSKEAKKHIGEKTTVCGKVVGSRAGLSQNGKLTFLDFDKQEPKPSFMMLIWGKNREKFKDPKKEYVGKQVCVTGEVQDYDGVPGIEATATEQVTVEQ
jgi:hypothetical protein